MKYITIKKNKDGQLDLNTIEIARFLTVSFYFFLIIFIESGASNASKVSYQSRVEAVKKEQAAKKPEWDATTTASQRNMHAEDRIAAKIASEVLRDNAKLRAVHSGNSIKQLLEREAKR